jgi:hypothetical protein
MSETRPRDLAPEELALLASPASRGTESAPLPVACSLYCSLDSRGRGQPAHPQSFSRSILLELPNREQRSTLVYPPRHGPRHCESFSDTTLWGVVNRRLPDRGVRRIRKLRCRSTYSHGPTVRPGWCVHSRRSERAESETCITSRGRRNARIIRPDHFTLREQAAFRGQ